MSLLPKSTMLGKLELFEVYDDFEGPKCFSAIDRKLKQVFLVYWSGDFIAQDISLSKWLYAPISHKRLDELRRQCFSIRDVFLDPEMCVYNVDVPSNGLDSIVSMLSHEQVINSNIPPESFYLEPDEIEVIAKEADWNFELKIAKKNKSTAINSNVVTKVIDALSAVVRSLMDDETKEVPRLYPLTATYGSFEVKLGSNDLEKSSVAIDQLNSLLSDTSSLDRNLKNVGLDPYILKDLLDIVAEDNLELTLSPKTYEFLTKSINIKSGSLTPALQRLNESSTTFIDSSLVPQASDLDRIIDMVCRKVNSEDLNHENIEGVSSSRQVEYHITAARCLGLLNKNSSVTSAGRLLHHKQTKEARYLFLSDRFESSDIGWAWMKWSNVNSIFDIDESTSKEFINSCVKGLNSTTKKRRSSTISTWLKAFKKIRNSEKIPIDLPVINLD